MTGKLFFPIIHFLLKQAHSSIENDTPTQNRVRVSTKCEFLLCFLFSHAHSHTVKQNYPGIHSGTSIIVNGNVLCVYYFSCGASGI